MIFDLGLSKTKDPLSSKNNNRIQGEYVTNEIQLCHWWPQLLSVLSSSYYCCWFDVVAPNLLDVVLGALFNYVVVSYRITVFKIFIRGGISSDTVGHLLLRRRVGGALKRYF